ADDDEDLEHPRFIRIRAENTFDGQERPVSDFGIHLVSLVGWGACTKAHQTASVEPDHSWTQLMPTLSRRTEIVIVSVGSGRPEIQKWHRAQLMPEAAPRLDKLASRVYLAGKLGSRYLTATQSESTPGVSASPEWYAISDARSMGLCRVTMLIAKV